MRPSSYTGEDEARGNRREHESGEHEIQKESRSRERRHPLSAQGEKLDVEHVHDDEDARRISCDHCVVSRKKTRVSFMRSCVAPSQMERAPPFRGA